MQSGKNKQTSMSDVNRLIETLCFDIESLAWQFDYTKKKEPTSYFVFMEDAFHNLKKEAIDLKERYNKVTDEALQNTINKIMLENEEKLYQQEDKKYNTKLHIVH